MDDLLEFVNFVGDNVRNNNRIRKRYVRDAKNPMEFYNEKEFTKRISKNMVMDVILPLIEANLLKVNNRGLPIPPLIQLLATLRYYANGNFQLVTGDLQGISQQSISVIIKRVSEHISEHLPEFICLPNSQKQKRQNTRMFMAVAGFPGDAGCLDCTHIIIKNPGGDNGEVFRNRKGFFSLNIQVAVGPQMEMMDILVRHPGSTHDSVIFDRSALRESCERGELNGLLLGDNGYPCRPDLLTPVINPGNENEARYTQSHIRTRNIVERVFGVWKRRFPVLEKVITTKLTTAQAVICATATLYNHV